MTKIKGLFLFAILFLLGTGKAMELAKDFKESSLSFTSALYEKVIKEKPNENVIMSPFSVHTAAALAFTGAAGETAEQMVAGLKLTSADRTKVAAEFKNGLQKYTENPAIKLANKLYLSQLLEPKTDFTQSAKDNFNSEVSTVNFDDAAKAAKLMNDWVEEKTQGKIKDMINPDSIDSFTRAFILNAVHFKGSWLHKFEPEKTKKADFWISETESVEVDMMQNSGRFPNAFLPDMNAYAYELPFSSGNISMVVVIPEQKTGLKQLETALIKENFKLPKLTPSFRKLILGLPRFRADFSTDMKEAFKEMGMPKMFNNANFTNLCDDYLEVSKIIHKAFIDVNEEGAEAAASTGFHLSARTGPIHMIADKPFLYFIKGDDDVIYFVGHYVKPK